MRTLFALAAISAVCWMSAKTATAQLGGFFGGGAKIETIETRPLFEMVSEQQKLIEKAKESGEEIPEAGFVVVDVRSEKEVNVSVIPGAITKAQYEKEPAKYRGKLVIPYCTVGGRSAAYAKQLARKNVKVKNYQGSILKWVDAGLPVVTLDGKPTNRVHTYSDRYRIPANYEQVTQ